MLKDLVLELTQCDQEPIHLCGAVQQHGYLIAFNKSNDTVEYVSQNVSDFLKLPIEQILGQSKSTLMAKLTVFPSPTSFLTGVNEVFEFELPSNHEDNAECDLLPIINALSRADNLTEIYALLAESVRQLCGYDRVMVYRFEDDWSGTVVGESIESNTYESFLALRFPAQDIPQQARELYRRNELRYIPSVTADSVPIFSNKEPHTLDLSMSSLRAVSPVHLEYLRNMQVAASMSISLIIDDKLWGLVACHNREDKKVNSNVRKISTTIGRLSSQLIALRTRSLNFERSARSRELQLDLLNEFSAVNDFHKAFEHNGQRMLEAVAAGGVVFCEGTCTIEHGIRPSDADLAMILDFLETGVQSSSYVTNELPNVLPGLSEQCLDVASGLLAQRLFAPLPTWIIWFRPEIVSEINWAGEPVKLADDETNKLHPRRSFKIWKQQVRGQSKSWSAENIDSASVIADYLRQRMAADSRFSIALEATPHMMLVVDGQGQICGSNSSARAVFGLPSTNLKNMQLKEILHDDTATTMILNKAGNKLPVSVERSPINTAEGLFFLYVVRDISEVLQAEEERKILTEALQDSNQKMEQFVDTIAHDLRAPLLSISNLSQWIESDLGEKLDGAPKVNMLTLRQRATKMREQLTSLLEYSKAGSARAPVEEVDTDQLVRSITDSIEAMQKFRIDLHNLPIFHTARAPLEHVLYNLLENASKYAGAPGGIIEVSCLESDDFFQFCVADRGKGIPLEYQEEVFYPMRRLDGAAEQGHGMGLAFVKRIVEQSGGKVTLTSSPGNGAKFCFLWRKQWKTT